MDEVIVERTLEFVRKKLEGESTGHDWWHTYRVWRIALRIARDEGCSSLFVIQLGALLHDIADWKFHSGDNSLGLKLARQWLEKIGVDEKTTTHVCRIIDLISFKGVKKKREGMSIEAMIVQDADRLDALGAIGIARCFATGAKLGKEIYNPEIRPKNYNNSIEYRLSNSTSINHFYEKLLILKDLMNTKIGKEIALERHQFLEYFLERFFTELNDINK
jgi:uncharacterized protein